VVILKGVKVLCFDTLSEVLILRYLERNREQRHSTFDALLIALVFSLTQATIPRYARNDNTFPAGICSGLVGLGDVEG
jgi:hypothetical protein